jgi:hypothetical protein
MAASATPSQRPDGLSRGFTTAGPVLSLTLLAPALVAAVATGLLAWNYAQRPPETRWSIFWHLSAAYDFTPAALQLGILAICLFAPVPPKLSTVVGKAVGWLGRRVGFVALCSTLLLSILSLTVHRAYPLSMDEHAAGFQAEIFAAGRLVGHWPPLLVNGLLDPGHEPDFIIASRATGEVFSGYSPGHALLMAPFAAIGAGWACNPVLSGLSLMVLARIVSRCLGEACVGWAVLFWLASPVTTAYGISFYSMPSHALLNMVFALLLLLPTPRRAALAGLTSGLALSLHNPFCHAVFAAPWIAWLAGRRSRLPALLLLGACCAPVYLGLAWTWHAMEQRAINESLDVKRRLNPSLATEMPAGSPPADEPSGAFAFPTPRMARQRALALVKMISWESPGLLAMAAWGAWLGWSDHRLRLFAASAAGTFVAYLFVTFDQGHGWGYRYFQSAFGCLPILAAACAAQPAKFDPEVLRRLGLAAAAGLLLALPLRLFQIREFIDEHLAQQPPIDARLIERWGTRVITFIHRNGGYYRSDLIRNDPFLRRGPLRFVGDDAESDAIRAKSVADMLNSDLMPISSDERGSVWVLTPKKVSP